MTKRFNYNGNCKKMKAWLRFQDEQFAKKLGTVEVEVFGGFIEVKFG